MKTGLSIAAKILIFNLILPILLYLVIAAVLFNIQYKSLYAENLKEQYLEGELVAAQMRIQMESNYQILKSLINLPATRTIINEMPNSLDWEEYRPIDSYRQVKAPLRSGVMGGSVDMLYIASGKSRGLVADREPGLPVWYDARERGWYTGAVADFVEADNGNTFFISDPYKTAEEGAEQAIAITISHAVDDPETGNVIGVAAMDFGISNLIAEIEALGREGGYSLGLMSGRTENVIWSMALGIPEEDISLPALAASLGYESDAIPDLVENILGGGGFSFTGATADGQTSVTTAVGVAGTPWIITVGRIRDDIVQEVTRKILPPMLGFGILFFIVMLTGFFITTRTVVRPIRLTTGRFVDLAAGDADLTARMEFQSHDEIGTMTENFNTFIVKLHSLVKDIKEAMNHTESIKDSVVSSSEESSTAIEEIKANLDSIDRQFGTLDGSLVDNNSATEQISANIASMDDQISDQAAMVEESTAAITQMIASLQSVAQITRNKKEATAALDSVSETSRTRMDDTQNAFHVVSDKMVSIQEMADTINNIASQTNLLSMNAAIEAAHAGDAGRGFAVVAEEIRKLAESAGDSSDRITSLINEVTSAVAETDRNVSQTAEAMDSVFREVKDTVDAFREIEMSVSELNTGGQQVLDASEQINTITSSIRNGSSEIKDGTSSMLSNSGNIKNISSRIADALKEISAGSGEIVDSMQRLVELSSGLSEVVDQINAQFGKFQT